MSHTNRVILYVIALVFFAVALVEEIVESKRLSPLAFLAAGLAVVDFIWLNDA